MRYSKDHKAETNQQILQEASRRFRRDGITATGLQPLMKALGLTHGGFYAHFKSKDDLVEQALQTAAQQSRDYWSKKQEEEGGVNKLVDSYLSAKHRDTPEKGCPLPTMSMEMGQLGKASATTDKMVERLLGMLHSDHADAPHAAVMLSAMVGALSLSRSVTDPALSEQLLEQTRAWIKQQLDESHDLTN
ncbi:TetR/AcrR family transcriptional regulator [Pokkaliibacter plantistimulans]|uniref:TetR/AcrR family transcriptional regulator n=1 Tax=Proteobacteria bacterium 228 TaxID=2083153 RepID=A0A2S5KPL3_9PROT|nr:TetR/AcrR family transcriptional regulator [Pokkaliibacter plantistimulans]PPC76787.1 TetR/AcrR family transcriptional regulator [Pokkaliibacter plantistimulans]